MTSRTPLMRIQRLDWINLWDSENSLVGSGPQPGKAAGALASASIYLALSQLGANYPEIGSWISVGIDNSYWSINKPESGVSSPSFTGINTKVFENAVQSVSIQSSSIWEWYYSLRDTGPTYAKSSTGVLGNINLTTALLTTTCSPASINNISANAILVQPNDDMSTNGSFRLQLGDSPSSNFSGASCELKLQQVLYLVRIWIDGRCETGLHVNIETNSSTFPSIAHSTSGPNEAVIMQQLSEQFTSLLPYLDSMAPQSSLLQHLVFSTI